MAAAATDPWGGGGIQGTQTIPPSAPVSIGNIVLPFGPRSLEYHLEPFVARQDAISASIVWDYGYKPEIFILRGYPSEDDPMSTSNARGASIMPEGNRFQIRSIIGQFDPSTRVQELHIPTLGVQASVRLLSADITDDADVAPKESLYVLQFERCDGSYTNTSPFALAAPSGAR